jgi:site-specific recombinase XerD
MKAGRKPLHQTSHIGEITEKWVTASYAGASNHDLYSHKFRVDMFLEFLNMTDQEFIETYKRSKDRVEWSKQMGMKVIAYYNNRVSHGYATNTVRAEVSSIRAFCRDNATQLLVPRKKIAKAKSAKGEHEFTLSELQKMYHVGDVRGKAVLATAVSLGFSVEDFTELRRDLIESLVNKALAEKIDFIPFDYERGKTGVESRSHLTPEAASALKDWFEYIDKKREEKGLHKSEWVWCNGNGGHLNEQTINDIIKELVQSSNIVVTGKMKFHLIRKFLMSALHDSGFDSWEVKRALGKEIPTTDDTYLKGLSRKVTEKFPAAYSFIRLSGFTNQSHTRMEDLEAKLQQLEIKMEGLTMENATLKRIIEFALPPEAIKKGLVESAKLLPNMNADKISQLENILKNAKSVDEMHRGLSNYMSAVKREIDII